MAFSNAELANIAASALDYYIKGPAFAQNIQEKPLLKALTSKQKTFPGGKGNISIPVVFDYTTSIAGFTHNDTVSYANPANTKRANYQWKEIHAGISLTLTELKHDGLSVTDSTTGASTSKHSERDLTVLTGILDEKLKDMAEGWARSFNEMLWSNGLADPKKVAGITSLITDDPTTGTVGGIDRATNPKWRNRAAVGANAITYVSGQQKISEFLRKEVRQLTRFGGKPSLVLCGSGFLEKLDLEITSKGTYTQSGFAKGNTDIGLSGITMQGIGEFLYDPTLDDLGYTNRAYFIDTNNINLMVMDGEDKKQHNPARPHDQYVLYRAMTWTGGLTGKHFTGSAVYEVV